MALGGALILFAGVATAVAQVTSTNRGHERARAHNSASRPTTAISTASRPKKAQLNGSEAIRAENAKQGSTDWMIPQEDFKQATFDKIAGFADSTSVQQGETFSLRVTTHAPRYVARVFRMGYYGGDGSRLIETSPSTAGIEQPKCPVQVPTNTVDCSGWKPQLDFNVDSKWLPGNYLIKLESTDGGASFVPITVRDDQSHADILLIS